MVCLAPCQARAYYTAYEHTVPIGSLPLLADCDYSHSRRLGKFENICGHFYRANELRDHNHNIRIFVQLLYRVV